MKMQFQASDDLVLALDREAEKRGVIREALIPMILSAWFMDKNTEAVNKLLSNSDAAVFEIPMSATSEWAVVDGKWERIDRGVVPADAPDKVVTPR